MTTSGRGGHSRTQERPRRRVPKKPVKRTSGASSSKALPASASSASASSASTTASTSATRSARLIPVTSPAKTAVEAEETQAKRSGYLGTSAPPLELPLWTRHLIEHPGDLVKLAHDLLQVEVLALDAEFSQPSLPYLRQPDEPSHRLALLQLAVDGQQRFSYIVDTQRIGNLSALQVPLQNATILKLFQGIGLDAKVLATRGLVARNTLDLEAVSRSIFGQRETGLQTMAQRSYGVWLNKSYQRADWWHRPLNPAMLAYAARDAEITLALYRWLQAYYPWAIELHYTPADERLPDVAEWILPYLEGARPRHVALAVAEAGIAGNVRAQQEALRQALVAVKHPSQRARVMRLITDLDLMRLAPELRPYLTSPASEERQSAARALGRLYDRAAIELVRPLLDDPVQEVRQAAALTVQQLSGSRAAIPYLAPPSPAHQPPIEKHAANGSGPTVKWSSKAEDNDTPVKGSWQELLQARFGAASASDAPATPGKKETGTD